MRLKRELRRLMAGYGRKGGRARARKLSPRRRRQIAKQGADARWHPQEILLI